MNDNSCKKNNFKADKIILIGGGGHARSVADVIGIEHIAGYVSPQPAEAMKPYHGWVTTTHSSLKLMPQTPFHRYTSHLLADAVATCIPDAHYYHATPDLGTRQ